MRCILRWVQPQSGTDLVWDYFITATADSANNYILGLDIYSAKSYKLIGQTLFQYMFL